MWYYVVCYLVAIAMGIWGTRGLYVIMGKIKKL